MRKISTVLTMVGVISGLTGCGAPADSEIESVTATTSEVRGVLGCDSFPNALLQQIGLGYQQVKNLALAGGKNLGTMKKTMGLPDPATFRTFADIFQRLDVSSIEALPNFDAPPVTADNIRELAAKLDAALAAQEDLQNPAWDELAQFTKTRVNRQQTSINYYLGELHCN